MLSATITKGNERIGHRSLLRCLGFADEDLNKPLVGIANGFTDLVPGHIHLRDLVAEVKAGVWARGGVPLEFPIPAVCDGLTMGHLGMKFSLPSRELVADVIEAVARAHCLDGLVLVPNCDKNVPGSMMAAARLDIPSVLVSGGPMLPGYSGGSSCDVQTAFESGGAVSAGRITSEQARDIELAACPTSGSCAGLFTANSMNCMAEALGLALPGNGTIPAVMSARRRLARAAGKVVMDLVAKDLRPRQILTRESFENAIACDMAIGGSTNTLLHLMAISQEAGVHIDLALFDAISRKTPNLVRLRPSGPHYVVDLDRAGGIQAVLSELYREGLVHPDCLNVNGHTLAENVAGIHVLDRQVIRSPGEPYSREGGLAVLFGTLAPRGAVAKVSAFPERLRHFRGPVRVFEREEDAAGFVFGGGLRPGDALIIRNEGPKGGPGMREMLVLTSAIAGLGLVDKVILITDGRFSGASHGAVIGHVSPEAAENGPVAAVRDGDEIELEILNRRIDLLVDEAEVRSRLAGRVPSVPELPSGMLRRYRAVVGSADCGAIVGA